MPSYESLALDFTDGDTFKRFTVPAPSVNAKSIVHPSCSSVTNVAEVDDPGWTFHPTVVSQSAGSFDVNVTALLMGEAPSDGEGPNELVQLNYVVY